MIQQLIRMKCIDPKRNSYRNYEIITVTDDSTVITRWGRIGSIRTRRKNYNTSTPQQQLNLIN